MGGFPHYNGFLFTREEIGNVKSNLLNSHKKFVSDEDAEQPELSYWPATAQ